MTNLRILRKSRKREPGDVFTYQLTDLRFGFGLLVRTDARMADWTGINLIYIYDAFSVSMKQVPPLSKNSLLLPPRLVNDSPWTRGFFEKIAHWPLTRVLCFQRHCFCDPTYVDGPRYIDEYDERIRKRFEPCGDYLLGNCFAVDRDICEALGLPVNDDGPTSLPGVRR